MEKGRGFRDKEPGEGAMMRVYGKRFVSTVSLF